MKYLYNPPLIIKKIFNHFYWQTTNNKILLTFDDGPNPATTEKILNTLNDLKIKALHFCVGENLDHYNEMVNKIIIAENHRPINPNSEENRKFIESIQTQKEAISNHYPFIKF